MKRGDYVRLPDGRVGIYSANIGYLMCRVVMPDWSIETPFKADLELIDAKDESNQFDQDVPVKLPKGASLGNGAKTTNTASSGVWIFTDKWYKTQSQWEGGYFVEGKWVSPKEVKKVKRIDDIRAWMPAGLNNTYEEFVQFLVETAVGVSDPKEFDNTFTEMQKSLFEQANLTACEHTEPLNSWQDHFPDTGKMIDHNKSTYVCGADVKGRGNIPVPEEADKDYIAQMDRKLERPFNPGDRVTTPYGEGVVKLVVEDRLTVNHDNGYIANVHSRYAKPVEEKVAKYTDVGGLMWKTGEGDLSVVMEMINYESSLWIDAPQEMTGSERKIHVAKKLLEKYQIYRKS